MKLKLVFIFILLFFSIRLFAEIEKREIKIKKRDWKHQTRSLFSPVHVFIDDTTLCIYFSCAITNAVINICSSNSLVPFYSTNTYGQIVSIELPENKSIYQLEIVIGEDTYIGEIDFSKFY